MTVTPRRSRRLLIALMSALAVTAIVIPTFSTLLAPRPAQQVDTPTTTTTAPALTIKPLPVRPVVSAFVTTPEKCPPPPESASPEDPLRICDIPRTAVYELEPEALTLQLTNVDTFRNPLTGAQTVQLTMTPESATQFGTFTAGLVGKQVAFVRDDTVVWGPKITAPIDGSVLQLSGELTEEQAGKITRMLKDGA